MLAEDRRKEILALLQASGQVKVKDLTRRFNISEVTIRHDLTELRARGLARRTHGGAIAPAAAILESPLHERVRAHYEEKKRIGLAAAAMISDGETVVLDSGTTTQEIARHLKGKKNLKVITNGVNVAMELRGLPGIQVIVLGGILRDDSFSIVGHYAEEMLDQFAADKVFLGATACDLKFGVSTPNPEEARVNCAMMAIAQESILVADSSKFGKRCLSRIAPLSGLDRIITDVGLTEEWRQSLIAIGPEVILV